MPLQNQKPPPKEEGITRRVALGELALQVGACFTGFALLDYAANRPDSNLGSSVTVSFDPLPDSKHRPTLQSQSGFPELLHALKHSPIRYSTYKGAESEELRKKIESILSAQNTKDDQIIRNEGRSSDDCQRFVEQQRLCCGQIKTLLADRGIDLPPLPSKVSPEYLYAAEILQVTQFGVATLLADVGFHISSLESDYQSGIFSMVDGSALYAIGRLGLCQQVLALDPPEIFERAPSLALSRVPIVLLAPAAEIAGSQNADLKLMETGFAENQNVFINVQSIAYVMEKEFPKDPLYLDSFKELLHAPGFETITRALTQGSGDSDRPSFRPVETSLSSRLMDGHFGIDFCRYVAASRNGTIPVSRTEYEWMVYTESASHEAKHVADLRSHAHEDKNVEFLRCGIVSGDVKVVYAAMVVSEMSAELDALRNSPASFMSYLLSRKTANFSFPSSANQYEFAHNTADHELYDAVIAEIRLNPSRYGIKLTEPTLELPGVTLSPEKQIWCQLGRICADPILSLALSEAVELRVDLAARKHRLATSI